MITWAITPSTLLKVDDSFSMSLSVVMVWQMYSRVLSTSFAASASFLHISHLNEED